MRCSLGALVFFGVLGIAAPAFADEVEDARAAMRRGKAALERRAPEEALAEFEEAKRLVPTANAPWFFAAQALLELERWPEVVQHLEAYLAEDPSVSDAAEVRAKLAELRARRLPGRVTVRADAEAASVVIDGAPRGTPRTYELPPGAHRVEVRAPGRLAASQTIDVVGDTEVVAAFALVPLAAAPGAEAPERPWSAPPSAPASPWRAIGWVAAGVGLAGLGVTVVVDAAGLGPAVSDYRTAARAQRSNAAELRGDAEALRAGVAVGYVASALVALSGGALIVFGGRAPARVAAR